MKRLPNNLFLSFAMILAPALVFVFAPAMANAQSGKAKDSSYRVISAYPSVIIRLGNSSKPEQRIPGPFSHFYVVDARPDTLRIGIHAQSLAFGVSENRQLILAENTSSAIAHYLNDRFASPDAPYAALIVLRTLWSSDGDYHHESLRKEPRSGSGRTELRLKAEVYAVKDSVYKALFRFDTLQISQKGSFKYFGPDLSAIFNGLADSAGQVAGRKWDRGRPLSLDDIERFNQSRLNPAVIRDSSLVKGVYSSFEEFKNNNPSIQNYEIKNQKYGSSLFLKEADGQSYFSREAWGYCDGKTVYIMKEGTLNAAWKYQKTWYFLSGIEIYRNDYNSQFGSSNYLPGTGSITTTPPSNMTPTFLPSTWIPEICTDLRPHRRSLAQPLTPIATQPASRLVLRNLFIARHQPLDQGGTEALMLHFI